MPTESRLGSAAGIRLGGFRLSQPLARGGMGAVWESVHVETGLPVAVKVLHSSDPELADALRAEIRSMATLEHPHVVRILDQGQVDVAAVQASDGRLVGGTPWFAMERLQGDLRQHRPQGWPDLRDLGLQLLDALAHAHARGLVHRDLKPGNVLYGEGRGWVLTDFGLAHRAGAEAPVRGATPAYAAPEQLSGELDLQGPPTDLYSLGCLMWTLSTGKRPYEGTQAEVVLGHLTGRLPPFRARMPVPEGFEAWLRLLLAAAPEARFQLAPDALGLLRGLVLAGRHDSRVEEGSLEGEVTLVTSPTEAAALRGVVGEGAEDRSVHEAPPPAPMPADWRGPRLPRPPREVVGAGLGLLGLHEPPMVRRHAERDALWQALVEVQQTRSVRVWLVEGPAGSGRTRLLRWLVHRVAELGAAVPVMRSASEPWGQVLRSVRVPVGDPEALSGWARRRGLDEDDARGLAELSTLGVADRRGALLRAMRGLGRRRPVVLALDDVHVDRSPLDVVRSAQASLDPLPLLVVLACEDVGAVDLEDVSGVVRLERPSLDELGAILRGRVHLEPGLVARVLQRASGDARFAVQLVSWWATSGALELSPTGFELREGSDGPLPETLAGSLARQLEAIAAGDDARRDALEVAAVIGLQVDRDVWQRAAAPDPGLLAALQSGGFARVDPADPGAPWGFTSSDAREVLLSRARAAGRLRGHHAAVAHSLPETGRWRRQRGRHLLAAGEPAAAIDLLLTRTVRGWSDADVDGLVIAEDALRALRESGRPESDPRWAEAWLAHGNAVLLRRDPEAALPSVERGLELARTHGHGSQLALGHLVRGIVAANAADRDGASRWIDDAVRLATVHEDLRVQASARRQQARLAVACGDLRGATHHARSSAELFRAAGLSIEAAASESQLAFSLAHLGEVDEARLVGTIALEILRRAGARSDAAGAANTMGDVERLAGDHLSAEEYYTMSARLFRAIGHGNAGVADLNACLLACVRGRYAQGLRAGRRALDVLGQRSNLNLIRAAHAIVVWPAAALGDWDTVDRALEVAGPLLDGAFVEPDVGLALGRAAALAHRAGQPTRARTIADLARVQLQALGDEQALAELP